MHQEVGILHPGAMGAAVGAQLVCAGTAVRWLPEGRGAASRRRAESAGLTECASLAELARCPVLISVCPPAAAMEVAETVAATGFAGTYVDANAISPRHVTDIAKLLTSASVVDGGIVGPPPRQPGTTRLYLSGQGGAVDVVRALFADSDVQAMVVDGPVGQASALKLAFATYNKLSFALAAQAYALAERHGVGAELAALGGAMLPRTPLGQPESIAAAAGKAWRWEGEMAEIGAACHDAELPEALLAAARELFAHWRSFKDGDDLDLAELLAALRNLAT